MLPFLFRYVSLPVLVHTTRLFIRRRGEACPGKAHDCGPETMPETTMNSSRSGRHKEQPSEVADREDGMVAQGTEGADDQSRRTGKGNHHEHGPKRSSPNTPQRIPLASIEVQQLNVPALVTDQASGKLGEGTTDASATLGMIEPWEERYISPAPVRGKPALRIEVSSHFSDGFVGGTADREVVVAHAPPDSRGAGANAITLGVSPGAGVGDRSNSYEQRLPREATQETTETAVEAATTSGAQRAAASEETATQNWPLDSPLVSAGLDRELRRGFPASFEELAEAFSSAEHKSLFEHDMFGWASSKSSPVGVGAPRARGEAYRGRGGGEGGGGVHRQRGSSVENVSVEVKTDVAYYTVLSGGAGSSGGRDQPWMGLLDGGGKNPSVVVVGELAFFEANGKGEPSTGHRPPATGTLTDKKSRTAYMKNAPGELKDDVFVYDEDQLSREIEAARSPSERRGQSSSSIAEGALRGGRGGGATDAERLEALQDSGVGFLCDAAKLDGSMFKLGRKKGFGGCSVIHALKMRKAADQRAVDAYTEGSGLVVKVVSQVRGACPRPGRSWSAGSWYVPGTATSNLLEVGSIVEYCERIQGCV